MNLLPVKYLIEFKGIGQSVFFLGLFNSLLSMVAFGLSTYCLGLLLPWLISDGMSLCGPDYPSLPLTKYIFPLFIRFDILCGLLVLYCVLCLLEAAYLTRQSTPHADIKTQVLFIDWLIRAGAKNMFGLFVIGLCLAKLEYKVYYAPLIIVSGLTLDVYQRGQRQGLSFGFSAQGWTPHARLLNKIMCHISIIYMGCFLWVWLPILYILIIPCFVVYIVRQLIHLLKHMLKKFDKV